VYAADVGAEAWVVLALLGVLAWWAVDWWTKAGSSPAPSLRCNNCPKLVTQIRRLTLGLIGMTIVWAATLVYALYETGRR
jgi:hypothetical protein